MAIALWSPLALQFDLEQMGRRRGSLPNVDTAGTHSSPDELRFDRYALKVWATIRSTRPTVIPLSFFVLRKYSCSAIDTVRFVTEAIRAEKVSC